MTTPNPAMRARYLADAVSTASPAKLLLMLYDRLVLDLTRGEQALGAGDRAEANAQLVHAQEIILELRTTLDTDAWSGAEAIASLYGFLLTELVGANVRGEAERVAGCRALVEQLRDTWREAAVAAAAPVAPAAAG